MSENTPRKSRSTSQPGYNHGGLEDGRDALLQDLGSVPQTLSAAELFNAVLSKTATPKLKAEHTSFSTLLPQPEEFNFIPKVSQDTIAAVLSKLNAEHKIEKGRWKEYQSDPRTMGSREDIAFSGLKTVIDSIIQASPYATTNLLDFKVEGFTAPVSDTHHDTSLPDAYMVLKESSIPEVERTADADNWDDIPVVFKMKLDDKLENKFHDDMRQVLWEMHHAMRNDARRRFMFGVTAENTQMRLWYTDRSVVTVSPAFNWITDHATLIQLVLGLASSTREELGYDESIRRVVRPPTFTGSGPTYEIDVHNGAETSTFVTLRSIANFGAHVMCGRGTRVWLVVEKGNLNGPRYVLKDCWIDVDREREGTVLELIRQISLVPFGDDRVEQINEGRKHFLTVHVHGDVLTRQYGLDQTLTVHRGGNILQCNQRISTTSPLKPRVTPSNSRTNLDGTSLSVPEVNSQGNVPSPPVKTPLKSGPLDRNMQHYRIVFNESAESLYDLKTFREFFQVILGAIMALQFLYVCGYIHRDVSTGNILRKDDYGVLIDLEYAKVINSTSPAHESATGTRQFMSIEVVAQEHVYPKFKRADPFEVAELPPWKHNPLHDLDSVWWISVWLVYMYAEEKAELADEDVTNFHKLFSDAADQRQKASLHPEKLLHGDFSPTYNQAIWKIVVLWRFDIYNSFVTARDFSDEQPTAQMIDSAYKAALKHVEEVLALDDSILNAPLSRMYQ